MRIFNLKRFEKNTLRAVFDIEMPSGLIVRGAMLHLSHGRHWVSMPGKPYVDAAGKSAWANIIDFRDGETRGKFQQLVLQGVLAVYRNEGAAA